MIRGRVEDGDPVKCILDFASRETVDLFVLGSCGLSGLLLGNNTHMMDQLADRAVLTVS